MTTGNSSLEGAVEPPSLNVWFILAFYVFMFLFILSFIYVVASSPAKSNPHLVASCNGTSINCVHTNSSVQEELYSNSTPSEYGRW